MNDQNNEYETCRFNINHFVYHYKNFLLNTFTAHGFLSRLFLTEPNVHFPLS